MKALAIKYRPSTFEDVVEQGATKQILQYQIETGTFKNCYLFCGGAGTGKTTCARIFANNINKGQGNPIELDAASNNSVDDVREIISQAKTKSIDSEYKVFILDECHSLSNAAWQAMLKLIEEPPAKSIFIFCTTDPQKIPKTIISRVQRYDFQRITTKSIVDRLKYILVQENIPVIEESIEYIAKIADGGMRDAITLLDKCISFNTDLSINNVLKAIGTIDYDTMVRVNNCIFDNRVDKLVENIENMYNAGKDLKLFIKQYLTFTLDVIKYDCLKSFEYLSIPSVLKEDLDSYGAREERICDKLLEALLQLNNDIKWEQNPKVIIISTLLVFTKNINKE